MTIDHHALLLKIIIVITSYCCQYPYLDNTSLQNANKKLITRYFDEGINKQKLNQMGEFFSQDYIWHQMDGKEVHSSQDSSHVSMLKFISRAIPGIHYTIDKIVAEGDLVAVSSTVTGTAKGEFFGYPASQKKVHFKQMFFFRLINHKIKEEWEVVDVAGIKEQLSKP